MNTPIVRRFFRYITLMLDNAQGFGGDVFYKESRNANLRQKASREVKAAFSDMWDTGISSLFIAAWYQVPFYGAGAAAGQIVQCLGIHSN